MADTYACKSCGAAIGPGEPDGGIDERLCLRCWRDDGASPPPPTLFRSFTVWRISNEVWGDIAEHALPSELGEDARQDDTLRIVWKGPALSGGDARQRAREAGVPPL